MQDDTLSGRLSAILWTYGGTGVGEGTNLLTPHGTRCAGGLTAGDVILGVDREHVVLNGLLVLAECGGIPDRFRRLEFDDGKQVIVGPEVKVAGRRARDIEAGDILGGVATVLRVTKLNSFGRSIEFPVPVVTDNGLVIEPSFLEVCHDLGKLLEFRQQNRNPLPEPGAS